MSFFIYLISDNMNNLLKYYYNIDVIDIIKINNNYIIYDDNNNYLLYKINDNININNTLKIIKSLKYPNKYFNIIININNKYISNIDNNNYVLLLINGIINEEITLNDIINNTNNYLYLNNKIDIVNLWSKKIDYLEYQVRELAKDNNELLNSFSFFLGLGENAISFIDINNINFNNIRSSLMHYRINYKELNINYYNILNTIIDYQVRDYSEYLKIKCFNNEDITNDINNIINNTNLNDDELKYLYARLLFPTIYFDTVEEILLKEKKETSIEIYINNLDNYLNMLNDVYLEIKKRISIDIPSWIKLHN